MTGYFEPDDLPGLFFFTLVLTSTIVFINPAASATVEARRHRKLRQFDSLSIELLISIQRFGHSSEVGEFDSVLRYRPHWHCMRFSQFYMEYELIKLTIIFTTASSMYRLSPLLSTWTGDAADPPPKPKPITPIPEPDGPDER